MLEDIIWSLPWSFHRMRAANTRESIDTQNNVALEGRHQYDGGIIFFLKLSVHIGVAS